MDDNNHIELGGLPDGWGWEPLRYLVDDTNRLNPKQAFPNDDFFYVDISSVDNKSGEISKAKTLLGQNAPSRARKVIKTGDVVFATTRPYLKNIAIITKDLNNSICSTGFCVLRPKEKLTLTKYIYFVCNSDLFMDQLIPKQRGASYPAVTDSDVYDCLVPVPLSENHKDSIKQQKRIVAKVENLLSEISEARRLANETRKDYNKLIASILNGFFSESTAAEHGWQAEKISDLCAKPQYGYTTSAVIEPIGPKFLRITDIQNGQVNWDNVPHCKIETKNIEKYKLVENDILFARSGATTGKTYIVKECPESIFASYLIRLKVIKKIMPDLLYWYFQSPSYWKQINPRGAALPNVNATRLAEIKVFFPTELSSQKKIISHITSINSELLESKKSIERDLILLDRLEQSILTQAFKGNL